MFKFIPTSTTGIKTRFGKFVGDKRPGLTFYIPIVERIHLVSNRLEQDTFKFNVKSKDNIFSTVTVAIQHRVLPEQSEKALFSLDNPKSQIVAYTESSVRSIVSQMSLAELYESQGKICDSVSKDLSSKMEANGYTIENTLITEIFPNQKVQDALNNIEASKREKEAASIMADADYIKKIKAAEAERDKKILYGQGISGQRDAILNGYVASVNELSKKLDLSPKQVMDLVLEIQKLEVLEKVGTTENSKTVFLNHNIGDLTKRLLESKE